MFGALSRMLGNLSVKLKLTLGFAVVLLLTMVTTFSGWRALNHSIDSSQRLSQIATVNDLNKDLRAERITYRVLADESSRTKASGALQALDVALQSMIEHFDDVDDRRRLTDSQTALDNYQADFTGLQQMVTSRQAQSTALQQHEQRIEAALDVLQRQLLQTAIGSQQGLVITQIGNLERQLESAAQQRQVPAYMFDPLSEFQQAGAKALDTAESSLAHLTQLLGNTPALQALASELSSYRQQLWQFADTAIAIEDRQNSLEKQGDQLRAASQALAQHQLELRDAEALAARSVLTATALLALLLGSLAAWLITQQISAPLKLTLEAAQRIAQGDLRSELRVNRRDELGQLQNSMQEMTLSLRELIGGIGHSSQQLSGAVGQLTTVAEQTQNMIGSQKDETDQVATAMNQMAATVVEVARNAEFASAAATAADCQAREGDRVVGQAVEQIERLADQVDDSIQAMRRLTEESGRIGTILEVIKSVSEQTNLLALNAAIEAARAGEAGRGFAVVADEVRALAQRTQHSTEEIEGLISNLNSGTTQVAHLLDSSRALSQDSVELSRQAGLALGQITETVSNIQGMNQQIATASEEQSAVAEEINRNVMTVRDIADQTAAASDQTAASSIELGRLGGQLQTLVGRFQL